MLSNLKQRFQRMPKSVALIGAFVAGIALANALFFVFRSSSKANDNLLPRAARVERVEGSVGLTHTQAQEDQTNLDWEEAQRNATLVTGDRIYARQGSRATVAFTGRNYARLDSGSALDILSLSDGRTQCALRNGTAIFDVGELEDGELFEVATPNGAFGFDEPGLYQLGIGDDGNAWISVLSGLAQVVGLEGTGQVSRGEMLTLVGEAASQILLAKLSPDYAGGIVNDYYGYRYPDSYDGRYNDYDAYLDDPDYYDTYQRSVSYQYVPDDIPGVYDLDTYGDWTNVDGYGHCWAPRVAADWAPYSDGYWDTGSVYGPTWISQEPWGWAPYHYGRWAYVQNRQWVWVPQYVEKPVYAPALVAFVPITQTQQIGWVPLAPGEAYLPRYYDANYQPQYFATQDEIAQVINVQQHYTNINYTQAITVVPVQDFTRFVDSDVRIPVNSQFIAQNQPVLDPYAIEGVRNVAITDDGDRRRFKMARAFRNQVLNTPVMTSVEPMALPGRGNMNEALRVATVPEQGRKNRLKVQDSGQVVTAYSQDGLARAVPQANNPSAPMMDRRQQIQELANRSKQGDRSARQELKRLAREQEMRQQNPANPAIGQAQVQGRESKQMNNQPAVEATQNPRKLQKQLDRQQMGIAEQQRAQMQQTQELTRQQRKAQRRVEEQRNLMVQQQQSPAGQQATPKQQMRAAQQTTGDPQIDQRRAQKQAMREQRQAQQGVQQQVDQQQLQKQQMKQQRRMQEQQMQQQQMQQRQAQAQINQQQQLKQQMKQQRRLQEQQAQQQQMQQQMQQQRRRPEQQMQQQQMQQQRQIQEQQMNQQRLQKQQMKQQRQMQEQQMQQRQMQQQQMQQRQQVQQQQAQQQMRQQQMQQQAERQQRKAERRAVQPQQAPQPQVVQPQQQPQRRKPVEFQGPPARSDAGAAEQQRRAEKAQRKAGKGNQ